MVRGSAPEGLLDTYDTERHTVGRQVLANIRAQVELLLGGPEVEPTRALLTELLAVDGVRRHLAGMISGLGIRYAVGGGAADPDAPADEGEPGGRGAGADVVPGDVPRSGDPAGLHPLLGRRLPDAWLEPVAGGGRRRTTELLRTGRGLLLSLAGNRAGARAGTDALRAALAPWADRVEFVAGPPEAGARFRRARPFSYAPTGTWPGPVRVRTGCPGR